MTQSVVERSSVRVNRLKEGGYTWTVVVGSDDDLESLRVAKETALQVSDELAAQLAARAFEAESSKEKLPF
jgi:hypothetical protein